jgi:hypothetical protein
MEQTEREGCLLEIDPAIGYFERYTKLEFVISRFQAT